MQHCCKTHKNIFSVFKFCYLLRKSLCFFLFTQRRFDFKFVRPKTERDFIKMNPNFVSNRWSRYMGNGLTDRQIRRQRGEDRERRRLERMPLQYSSISASDSLSDGENRSQIDFGRRIVDEMRSEAQYVWDHYNVRWQLDWEHKVFGQYFWTTYNVSEYRFNKQKYDQGLFLYEYVRHTYKFRLGDDIIGKFIGLDDVPSQIEQISGSTDLFPDPNAPEETKLRRAREEAERRMGDICNHLYYMWVICPEIIDEQYDDITSSKYHVEQNDAPDESDNNSESQRLLNN